MPVPRWVATVNRRFTNRVLRVVATRLPGLGSLLMPDGVIAAGGCELERRRQRTHLGSPRIVHDETRRHVPAPVRPVLGLLAVSDFLTLQEVDAPKVSG